MTLTPQYIRLAKNIVALTVVKGSNFIIPLITLPYLVRVLGLEGYGTISFALSLAQFVAVCVQYGFNISATRDIARDRHDPVLVDRHYTVVLSTSLLLALLTFSLYLLTILLVPMFREHFWVFLFSGLYLALQAITPVWLFQGLEKMQYITYIHLTSRFIFLGSMLLLVTESTDVVYVPALNMIATLIALIAALIACRSFLGVGLVSIAWADIRSALQQGRDIFLAQFAPNLYKNASIFILGIFTHEALVGAYSAALKLVEVAVSGAQILSAAAMPILSRNMSNHRLFSLVMCGAGLGLSILLFAGADVITSLLLQTTSEELTLSLKVLACSIFFVYCHTTFGINFLMLMGKQQVVKNFTLVISILGLGLLLILVPLYSYLAALLVVTLNRAAMATFSYGYYRRYRGLAA
ncbi:MAG: oligosaccharide flippase family protein [Pseudomonadota bacterium]|nr:oligosaccharide flippase family protein [Pseudomonadota bacterium]